MHPLPAVTHVCFTCARDANALPFSPHAQNKGSSKCDREKLLMCCSPEFTDNIWFVAVTQQEKKDKPDKPVPVRDDDEMCVV